jgi:hypothetical protein
MWRSSCEQYANWGVVSKLARGAYAALHRSPAANGRFGSVSTEGLVCCVSPMSAVRPVATKNLQRLGGSLWGQLRLFRRIAAGRTMPPAMGDAMGRLDFVGDLPTLIQ